MGVAVGGGRGVAVGGEAGARAGRPGNLGEGAGLTRAHSAPTGRRGLWPEGSEIGRCVADAMAAEATKARSAAGVVRAGVGLTKIQPRYLGYHDRSRSSSVSPWCG